VARRYAPMMTLDAVRRNWKLRSEHFTVALAAVAIVLSQLPPISHWVARQQLAVNVDGRLGLPVNFGIVSYDLYVEVQNLGTRDVVLSDLRLEITEPTSNVREVPAALYVRQFQYDRPSPYASPRVLSPGASLTENVEFTPVLSPDQEEELSNVRTRIESAILAKQVRSTVPGQMVEVDERVVADAKAFFNKNFNLQKGKYLVRLMCNVDGRPTELRTASFMLYDHHVRMFKAQTEDYRLGFGLYYNSTVSKEVSLKLSF
jgi:hypothetical protein